MKKELWLARDEDGYYRFYRDDPDKTGGDWHGNVVTELGDYIEEGKFRTIFGCHPVRKGRKKRIKRILIELED